MNAAASVNLDIQGRLDRALEKLAVSIRREVPTLRVAVQHGWNDCFPWRTVARFTNGADEARVADVSIDCHASPQAWRVEADVCREDGYILAELPAIQLNPPVNEGPRLALPDEVLTRLEEFLTQQDDCIIRELTP